MIFLCWDISKEEYEAEKDFWDQWLCESCNGGKMRRPKHAQTDSRSDLK